MTRARASEHAWRFPPLVRAAMRGLVQSVSGVALRQWCELKVSGRGNIPWNRSALVVANHVSHLDAGVVCLALGRYATRTRIAAAADYFFDSPLKASFFENCTDLVPIHRAGSTEDALGATELELLRGRSLLIFPEGSRNTTAAMRKFRPGVGHLALATQTGVLPIWHVGTWGALPKGRLLPRRTMVDVRIGKFLPSSLWQERLEHVERHAAARIVTALTERAVSELSHGGVLSDAEAVLDQLLEAQGVAQPGGRASYRSEVVLRAGGGA